MLAWAVTVLNSKYEGIFLAAPFGVLSMVADKLPGGRYEMKLSVAYQGGTRYDILSDRHRVVTDQPEDGGGADAGMTPVELFVGSLASCVDILSASSARGTTSRAKG